MGEYRVLVTGSRLLKDRELVDSTLDKILAEHPVLVVVHGACETGADLLADDWVAARQSEGLDVRPERYHAPWRLLGKAAGPARNQEMCDEGADECVAFPVQGAENKGTKDCVMRAVKCGIPARLIRREKDDD